ncbi:hypothetical protein H5S40_00080 [Limosilactobacillus sp. RRLNB_1_1]|uniref:HEPN domain-containing protein n=1 Tax=Limosilactobacillus albertensis TaxID=2759752 RepID=A0A7W3TPQ0_9LACO|nr:hypothetical protein [Limosilactobacillus albertensis]MBB1068603.1 hypothetical protein [Limosilactobacillus albertensis]MCD7119052.1 hypothetical protein [Limosilactobacillus albertensis]MCD7129259.1 hypothetical protein [Limosilactobacillus albertensis]
MKEEIEYEEVIELKKVKDWSLDYRRLAISYYRVSVYLASDILENSNNPRILDTVFPVSLFLARQGIELLCKSLILKEISIENSLILFKENGHNIYNLWQKYKEINPSIDNERFKKLSIYFETINKYNDANSDLWRYPLFEELNDNQEKLKILNGKTISIKRTFGSLSKVFSLLLDLNDMSEKLEPYIAFINEKEDALSNCYLWENYEKGEQYTGRAIGYIKAAKMIFSNELLIDEKIYPLACVLRQGIELLLKDYLASNFCEFYHNHHVGSAKHGAGKKVIDSLKEKVPKIEWRELNIIRKMLEQIDELDREGNKFRYPTSLDFFNKTTITIRNMDIDVLYSYVISIAEYFDYLSYLIWAEKIKSKRQN